MDTLDRRTLFRRGLVAGTGLAALGPLERGHLRHLGPWKKVD